MAESGCVNYGQSTGFDIKRKNAPQLQRRLVQVRFGSTWYSYLTSVLDPQQLPPFVVADLYRRRVAD